MEFQDPSITTTTTTYFSSSNQHNPHQNLKMYGNADASAAFAGLHHSRYQSEASFQLLDDMNVLSSEPQFTGSTNSREEIGSGDDLFSTYIDVEKLGCGIGDANCTDQKSNGGGGGDGEKSARSRHRHCNSVDGSSAWRGGCESVFGEILDAKKAMPPEKLAKLWTVDPKRAKRILANRQSAARSKERKAHYIIELERRVQTLQTEATTLSAQMTLYQRDTTELTTENTQFQLRLQAMEQQAQLRDDLNEALKKEVSRLKLMTGELATPSDSFDMGMHNMPYTTSTFYELPQKAGSARHHQNAEMQPTLNKSKSKLLDPYLNDLNKLTDYLQSDPLGRLQGLDISSHRGTHIMKSECPSISASESSSS